YVPLIGILIMLTWFVADVARPWSWARLLLAPVTGVLLFVCAARTWVQVSYWHDSFTLWQHALDVTSKNWLAHYTVAFAYAEGNGEEAERHFASALECNPLFVEAHDRLGVLFVRQGKLEEAKAHFTAALTIKPDYERARQNLASIDSHQAWSEIRLH